MRFDIRTVLPSLGRRSAFAVARRELTLRYVTGITCVAARTAAVRLNVCRLNVRLCLRGCADAAVQSSQFRPVNIFVFQHSQQVRQNEVTSWRAGRFSVFISHLLSHHHSSLRIQSLESIVNLIVRKYNI